jgi:hypothetical protein
MNVRNIVHISKSVLRLGSVSEQIVGSFHGRLSGGQMKQVQGALVLPEDTTVIGDNPDPAI